MAEEKKQGDNVGKIFEGVKFEKVEDSYTVNVQYNSETEILLMKLVNEKSKNVFKQEFDKERIGKITEKCQLKPGLVVKMIVDTLSSKDLTSKNLRIYYLPNNKQGIYLIFISISTFIAIYIQLITYYL